MSYNEQADIKLREALAGIDKSMELYSQSGMDVKNVLDHIAFVIGERGHVRVGGSGSLELVLMYAIESRQPEPEKMLPKPSKAKPIPSGCGV